MDKQLDLNKLHSIIIEFSNSFSNAQWNTGNCLLFSDALHIWSKKKLSQVVLWDENCGELTATHVVCAYTQDKDYIIDADGVREREEYLSENFHVVDISVLKAKDVWDIRRDKVLSKKIAGLLESRYKAFNTLYLSHKKELSIR